MPLEHASLKRMIVDGIDATQEARAASERARDYYDGKQRTAAVEATLKARRQPLTTNNILRSKVDAMVGIEQKGRVDPVAYPRNPDGEESADVATKALRFVEEQQRVDMKRSDFFYNICIEGYGGVEVIAEEKAAGKDVKINLIRWEELIFDPHSREKDFSDASYTGIIKWMTRDRAREFLAPLWQGTKEELDALMDTEAAESSETYDDRPQSRLTWYDKKLERVRIAQVYYRCDGQWYMTVMTGRGEITNDISPWKDHLGVPENPMVLGTAYIDRTNARYGFCSADTLSQQDAVNMRESKLLHMMNTRTTWGVKGAVESVDKMKKELAKTDGHVEVDPAYMLEGMQPPFNIIPNSDQVMGQFQLLERATQRIDNLGPNAALMGQMSAGASGRAMMAAQQAGMAELAPIYDGLRDWTERVYRMIWSRIKQFWTAPKWIRVTADTEAPKFIGLNMPTPAVDQMGQPMIDPMTGQPAMQVKNPVAEMDVDIIVDQAPDYATLRAEQFDKLVELAKNGFPIPPQVIIESSDLRDKRKIIEGMQPQQAPPDPMVQRAQMAEISVKETQAKKNDASAQKDLAEIGQIQVETESAQVETVQKHVKAAHGIFTQ